MVTPLLETSGRSDGQTTPVKPSVKDAALWKIVLFVNLGMVVYTCLQSLTKDMLTNRSVKIYEFVFFRSFFNLCASALLVKQADGHFFADVPKELRCTLFMRCAVGTVSFMVFSMTVKYLPLGIFFIVFNSSPFFTVILSYFWTSDRILPLEGLAMIGAFCGIVVLGVSKPMETPNIEDNESFSKFEIEHGY